MLLNIFVVSNFHELTVATQLHRELCTCIRCVYVSQKHKILHPLKKNNATRLWSIIFIQSYIRHVRYHWKAYLITFRLMPDFHWGVRRVSKLGKMSNIKLCKIDCIDCIENARYFMFCFSLMWAESVSQAEHSEHDNDNSKDNDFIRNPWS